MKKYSELFTPGYIGHMLVKNRVVMAPMLVSYANPDGEVSDALVDYYEARAHGGAGLIIVEAACIDAPAGRESFRQLNVDGLRYLAGLDRLARSIKAYGSRVFLQLFHAGRQTSQLFTGVQPVAPSPLACPMIKEIPHELSINEIKIIEKKFVKAAQYAGRAGYDGIELHAAHGYLINQFLSPDCNCREDEYGGSLANRMRFLLNIVEDIKISCPGLILSVRLNIDDFMPGGLAPEESVIVCQHLEQAGVDIINCSSGTYGSGLKSIEPVSFQEGWRSYLAREVKKAVEIPVITGGMIGDPGFANQLVANQEADFVFLGRSLLADSEWPNKVREGRAADIRPCIRCNNCIDNNFKGMMVDCTVNPSTGREIQFKKRAAKIHSPATAVVVGGGPAGMQAALSLSQRGLEVALYERDSRLGGLLNLAAIPPHKHRVAQLRDYLIRQLNKSTVDIRLNSSYSLTDLESRQPDYLVIASGSKPLQPKLKGWDESICLGLADVLEGRVKIHDKRVVVVGGGINGCEVADFLLDGDNYLAIIEQKDILAADMEKKNRRDMINRLEKGGMQKKTGCKLLEINDGSVLIAKKDGSTENLPADYVILAAGFASCNDLYFEAKKIHHNVYLIGDAFEVKGFKNAFLQGEMVGHMIASNRSSH